MAEHSPEILASVEKKKNHFVCCVTKLHVYVLTYSGCFVTKLVFNLFRLFGLRMHLAILQNFQLTHSRLRLDTPVNEDQQITQLTLSVRRLPVIRDGIRGADGLPGT